MAYKRNERELRIAVAGEEALGPLKLLPGTWANIRPEHRLVEQGIPNLFQGKKTLIGQGESPFDGRGWNLIALPFAKDGEDRNYRILMNQYNEVLTFNKIDDKVPNRGITEDSPANVADQKIAALDYEQMIAQIAARDISEGIDENGDKLAGGPGLPIHHEPGFFLHMRDQRTDGLDISRLATIPHGNSVTALGKSKQFSGPPNIEELSGFPEGVADNIADAVEGAADPKSYLFPYREFTKNPFKGVLGDGFPGFSPANANSLLNLGLPSNVKTTTELPLDTTILSGGISNIPFVVKQADAAEMRATFWIMELDEVDSKGRPRLVLAYSQFIFLDFFERFDGKEGKIRWPHISINMMEKIEWPEDKAVEKRTLMAAK